MTASGNLLVKSIAVAATVANTLSLSPLLDLLVSSTFLSSAFQSPNARLKRSSSIWPYMMAFRMLPFAH